MSTADKLSYTRNGVTDAWNATEEMGATIPEVRDIGELGATIRSISCMPSYKIYGVRIDTTNSNPETSVVYTDDAVGMVGGSASWDTTFLYNLIKPCLLLNGVVTTYLDKNNFSLKENGTPADITSGAAGDVMIEIPKCAYMMYTEGIYQYIKITDAPDAKALDSRFVYYGHTRATEGDRNNLYVGAYLGFETGSKLRSLSGKTPTTRKTIVAFRTLAKANGAGYDQMAFYPLTLIQCLYTIKYKHLNSQIALGRGFIDENTAVTLTGGANTRGMYYGENTGKQQMVFAGIEDFWGNLYYWIDGLYSDASWNILTGFTNFNDTGSGYANRGQGATSNISGYMTKIQGDSQRGFINKALAGSLTTYFSDYTELSSSTLPFFGGSWAGGSYAGAFALRVAYSAANSSAMLGARLMFL